MMYPYITLADETLITHSQLLGDGEDKSVEVHFERPTEGGFDMARCVLPTYTWIIREGYSDEEIAKFHRFLKRAAGSFYRYAAEGGHGLA
ncbi:MAG: hypothetical protein FWH20_10215 [Oscillospiraceae bacterium]|nr:hypothetical protein [Oscillospiraceae bacterium]